MKTTIILPTYNEAGNITSIIERILSVVPEVTILVADDNSPDGTADVVRSLTQKHKQVELFFRGKKEGLGRAYLSAFRHVLQRSDVEFIVTMDADHSHDPEYLPAMLECAKTHDVVVGSRYCHGGGTQGWEFWRVVLSRFGNLYARFVTRTPVNDMTAGFIVLRASFLRSSPLERIELSGYAFLMELKYLLWRRGARMAEVPIIFKNRREGESKITNHIIREGLIAPWRLRSKHK